MIAALGWPTWGSVRHVIFFFSCSSWVIPHMGDVSGPWEMGFQIFLASENQGLEGALAVDIQG